MSLVELVLMSAAGSLVIAAAYLLFSAGSRQGSRMEQKLRGVQSAQLLLERLRTDLAGAAPSALRPVRVESIADGSRNRLTFECHAPAQSSPASEGRLVTRRVTYLFDPATHAISRNGEPLAIGTFAAVAFHHDRAVSGPARPADGDTLTVVATTAPPDALAKGGTLDPRVTSTFVVTLALVPGERGGVDPAWVPNAARP